MSHKTCTICDEFKPIDQFHNSKEILSGKKAACAECSRKTQKRCVNTHDGFLKNLVRGAKKNAKKHERDFSLNALFIFNLWERQQGKCYYTGIPMVTRQNCDWQCSIERVDTLKGYIEGNVVLCCSEMNNQFQWSLEKVEIFKRLYCMPHHEIITPDFYDNKIQIVKRKKVEEKIINDEEYRSCNMCGQMKKKIDHYDEKSKNRCKACYYESNKKINSTPKSHLKKLIRTAKNCTKEFKRIKRAGNFKMDIDFDYLVKLWNDQGGLCAYTGIPLHFGFCKDIDWACSIERKDAKQGYNKNNVCLIAAEFNTSIRSSVSNPEDVTGDSGWNLQKIKTFIDHW